MAKGPFADRQLHKYATVNKSRVFIGTYGFRYKKMIFTIFSFSTVTSCVLMLFARMAAPLITFKYGHQADAAVAGANDTILHGRRFTVQIDRPHPSVTETPFPIGLYFAPNFWEMQVAENPFPGRLFLHYVGPR